MPAPHPTASHATAPPSPSSPPTAASAEGGQRWGRIPAWWLDHPDLDADGLAVLAALSTYADETGVCWPSQTTLASKLKRSRPTVNRLVGRLEAMGLLVVEHRKAANGGRLSCRYRLCLTPKTPLTQGSTAPDSSLDSPCSAASQKQVQIKQIPDSLSPCEHERMAVADAEDTDRHSVSNGWTPSASDRAWAAQRFPKADLDGHAELFRHRCQAHGYRYKDVGAAWRSWLLQDLSSSSPTNPTIPAAPVRSAATPVRPAAAKADMAEQRLNAWSSVAARLSNAPVSSSSPSWGR